MKTTRLYLHLAGVVLHDEAERLEARLLGAGEVSTQLSTHLGEPERIERHVAAAFLRLDDAVDPSDELQLF